MMATILWVVRQEEPLSSSGLVSREGNEEDSREGNESKAGKAIGKGSWESNESKAGKAMNQKPL